MVENWVGTLDVRTVDYLAVDLVAKLVGPKVGNLVV